MTDSQPPSSSNAPAYSVSELAGALKRTLETAYDHIRVRGEISKITRHTSGHVYLTLKDDKAAIDGVIWKGSVSRLQAKPEQGLEVIITGKITTFPASSKYQIIIETLEAAGIGALLAQLEQTKARLSNEGLFDPSRKRPLPFAPAIIGVITSPTGAVIRDILHRIRERWPCRVVVWPVVVQGAEAAPSVISALKGFEAGIPLRPDVIIVARGGGSVEDLWAFNDEALARQVSAMTIPIVSAIGHETDTTMIDYVADRRAPTPTGAAEITTPVRLELEAALYDHSRRLTVSLRRKLDDASRTLIHLSRAISDPKSLLLTKEQAFDFALSRFSNVLKVRLFHAERALITATSRFGPSLLERPIAIKLERALGLLGRLERALDQSFARARQKARTDELIRRANQAVLRTHTQKKSRLETLSARLETVNPNGPLARGFVRVMRDGVLVSSAHRLQPNDLVSLVFHDGQKEALISPKPGLEAPKPQKTERTKPLSDKDQISLF